MNTASVEANSGVAGTPHPHAAIVFGSGATDPVRKPASVRATCEAIGLPRSTYYYQSHRSASAIALEQKIVLRLHELRQSYPEDGYRRMTRQLQQEGFHVNRKRIARLMQLHSLTSRSRKAESEASLFGQPQVLSDLSHSVVLTGPHQVWVADLAYVHTRSSLVYAAAIIDLWSREVVGYAASLQISGRLPSIALHAAVRAHRPAPGCIHHSNSGTQYRMRGYWQLLRKYGLVPSLGDARDHSHHSPPPPRQVVEMPAFDTWAQVAEQVQEFMRTLYSCERIDRVLGDRSSSH